MEKDKLMEQLGLEASLYTGGSRRAKPSSGCRSSVYSTRMAAMGSSWVLRRMKRNAHWSDPSNRSRGTFSNP